MDIHTATEQAFKNGYDKGRMDALKQFVKDKKRYNIYYQKYNIIARDYIPYIKVVETTDVYHEIGKMICNSIEEIKNIRYTEPKASKEKIEAYWIEKGYRQIDNSNYWVKDQKENG